MAVNAESVVTLSAVTLFVPSAPTGIVWLHTQPEEAAQVWALLHTPKPVLAVPAALDWNRDLSPWYADGVFRGGGTFAGGAGEHLARLTGELLPAAEKELGFTPAYRALAGYSLAGLFAVWALYNTPVFDRVASMSGSLWFDGFIPYIQAHRPCRVPTHAFFSLGEREKNTKNPRMAKVEDCTQQAVRTLRAAGVPAVLQMNPGGHFSEVQQRTATGIDSFNF